jgi:hypothetical protein
VLRNNAIKAEQVLKEMMTLQEQGYSDNDTDTIAPNTESFNYVIRAWTRCRQDISMADKVMEVLRAMELYQRTGEGGVVKANTISCELHSLLSSSSNSWHIVLVTNAYISCFVDNTL